MNPDPNQPLADHAEPKWVAVFDDTLLPMPGRRIRAAVLREQSGLPDHKLIVRDHNSDHDPVIGDAAMVDLVEGNVFYGAAKADVMDQRPECKTPAKLAYSVNDEWKEVIRPRQTGRTVRDLFGLTDDVELLRDLHSPNDEVIADRDDASFERGCVLKTRHVPVPPPPGLDTKIIVNGREKVVAGRVVSFEQVVTLAFGSVDPESIYTMTYAEGPRSNPEGSMVAGDRVNIQTGMIFNVTPTRRS